MGNLIGDNLEHKRISELTSLSIGIVRGRLESDGERENGEARRVQTYFRVAF